MAVHLAAVDVVAGQLLVPVAVITARDAWGNVMVVAMVAA